MCVFKRWAWLSDVLFLPTFRTDMAIQPPNVDALKEDDGSSLKQHCARLELLSSL
jgi:hypothetical protein